MTRRDAKSAKESNADTLCAHVVPRRRDSGEYK